MFWNGKWARIWQDPPIPRLISAFPGWPAAGKQILNSIAASAASAADRSQFAALPARYLDDVGLTEGERAAALGYDDPLLDPWRVIASHL